jgi:hypothetical protein
MCKSKKRNSHHSIDRIQSADQSTATVLNIISAIHQFHSFAAVKFQCETIVLLAIEHFFFHLI